MKRTISSLIALSAGALLSTSVFAVSLNGTQWQTIDDKTGEKKAVIQLTESGGKVNTPASQAYFGRPEGNRRSPNLAG